MSRKENERTKLIQEKCGTLLTQMLRDEDNKYCVDCDAKGPRWASWNLGVFLCIRCAGIHRNLGVHISRVKSVNLDSWTPEQVISLQQMGNSRARAVYEAQLPDGFRRPQTDTALESFIRAKYEHKKYLAREWVPPLPPKVDWAKEIDEELERQKRKKKAAQVGSALGLSTALNSTAASGEKKLPTSTNTKSSPLPAPLPKPKPGQSGSSPKTHRTVTSTSLLDHSSDLLGLTSPTQTIVAPSIANDLNNDSFSSFLSAPAAVSIPSSTNSDNAKSSAESQKNSLAKEEEDFFNQGGSTLASLDGKDKSGKMTKDSILALYASGPPQNAGLNQLGNSSFNHLNAGPIPPLGYGVQPQFGSQTAFPGSMGFMGGVGGLASSMGMPPSQSLPQQPNHHNLQQHPFMASPNPATIYNTPVMTVPNAFTTTGMHGVGGAGSGGMAGTGNLSALAGFGAQFPPMPTGSFSSPIMRNDNGSMNFLQ